MDFLLLDDDKVSDFETQPYAIRGAKDPKEDFHWQFDDSIRAHKELRSRDVYMLMYKRVVAEDSTEGDENEEASEVEDSAKNRDENAKVSEVEKGTEVDASAEDGDEDEKDSEEEIGNCYVSESLAYRSPLK